MNKIKNLYDKKGFTLIEVVTSIVILAILGTIAGIGFVSTMHGYFIAKGNTDTVQNAEIILARLAKEINSTGSITSGNQTSLTFLSKSTNPVDPPLTLSWDNPSKILSLGPDTLANNVSSFSLSYFNKFNDVTAGTTYSASTAIIKITLSLTGADNVISIFEERVFLYNLMTGLMTGI
jgi:prepilin-type N-terminal cleavage/methylation domain-containing protein